ncbi:MAG: ParA family protein [bacterium]|nr:ParA family protein [bacterium]
MITAVTSRKGGVSKTTTAVNLAAALAGIGKRVLLVDLDSQASASLSLGVPRSALFPCLADVLLGSRPAADTIRSTATLGLDLITASTDLQSFDREIGNRPGREACLKNALEPIVSRYDFVMLDCPPHHSLLSLNGLVAADNFMVPIVPHYLAVTSLEPLLWAAERLPAAYGVRPRLLGIVMTQVDYRTKAARTNATRIRERFGDAVFAVEIRVNVRLAEAPEAGKTIFEFDPTSTGARSYRLLAAEMLMRARGAGAARTGAHDSRPTTASARASFNAYRPADGVH